MIFVEEWFVEAVFFIFVIRSYFDIDFYFVLVYLVGDEFVEFMFFFLVVLRYFGFDISVFIIERLEFYIDGFIFKGM